MALFWVIRRSLIFLLVHIFRLRNFLWRASFQRFTLRLRANARGRFLVESIQFIILLLWLPLFLAMNQAATPKNRRVLALVGRSLLLTFLFLLCATFNMPWNTQHLAVISSNYFALSSSYPSNTMVVLFNAQRRFWPPWPILCRSQNGTHSLTSLARVRYAFTPILICGWSVYLAVCPTVQKPVEFALRDTQMQSNSVAIPYRTVSAEKFSVVACFSPLFYNERWQLIIPTLEIYRQYGLSLQVYYIQSMLVEILDFMKAYERAKVVRLETWTRLNVTTPETLDQLGYDPNAELEWRNQAAAHTDCLLFYKEAADFVLVSDLDDVLIPKLGTNFLEEFQALLRIYPAAAGFQYNRYNTELITSNDPADFSLTALINEARVSIEWEDPKYVVRPSHVQSVWLHWPGIIDRGRMYTVDEKQNFMFHFRNWSMIDLGSSVMPRPQRIFTLYKYQIADKMGPEAATRLDLNFRAFLDSKPGLADLFSRLPQRVIYYPIIAACYNRIFYGRHKRPANCPGPLRCVLPPLPGIRCAIGTRHYGHAYINRRLAVHFPLEPRGYFEIENSGCRI